MDAKFIYVGLIPKKKQDDCIAYLEAMPECNPWTLCYFPQLCLRSKNEFCFSHLSRREKNEMKKNEECIDAQIVCCEDVKHTVLARN